MTTMFPATRCLPLVLIAAALLLAGCPSNSPTSPSAKAKPGQPLVVVVVDDAPLGEVIAREWRARTEEEVKLVPLSAAEAEQAGRLPGDAIVFPTGLLGQLIEKGLILPLSNDALEDPDFDHRDIFTPLRMEEMRWGQRTVAVTLGSPRLLVAYRTDMLEKLKLQPPNDWSEYQQLVERLADRAALGELAPSEGQTWRAAVEPLADGWAGQVLLARAASYALHRDQISPLFKFDSFEPLIAEPPYRRALEELTAAAKAGGFAAERLTPEAAFEELRAGRTALALTWPTPTATKHAENSPAIGFALLPGAAEAYNFATKSWDQRSVDQAQRVPLLAVSGRLAAVTSSSADARRAEALVVWLAGREAGGQVCTSSAATTLFRNSQTASPARWTPALSASAAKQYADALTQSMAVPRAFPGLRLPGRSEYLAALDKAVQQAASGDKSAAESLSTASERWRAITKARGLAEQQRANARSLGQQPL